MFVNLVKHTRGCHCGRVRFEVLAKPVLKAYDCNCTICVKKGMFLVWLTKENFKLTQGDEHISCYTYNTHQAKHYFCSTCGVHPFYQPRSNPKGRGISLQCLDEEETRKKAEIVPCDAADWRNWEKYLDEHPKARNLTENVE
ncbi:centromere protein V-like [Stylophora pistillata]|uniref:centromere protein V-like n=1 Tax=Stylophora pistillata TaxID=50429 RepID=UPI000C04C860|nr:centromere protein V-like [Stylophora pistillata]